MSGVDRLNGGTDTPTMSQRPESGEVILDGKEGRGMWVWSVLAVLSSRMSAGGFSLGGCRDNVPCLAITTILCIKYADVCWLVLALQWRMPTHFFEFIMNR
jgi:hypothetical protein